MKQKRVILDTVPPENSASKLPQLITFYINTNRDKLEYKDGSIPFSITTFSKFGVQAPDFTELYTVGKVDKQRITKNYILENYYVYRIADYGNQSLSPGISDFSPFVYDSSGNKLPQYMIGIIRNYTTKEAFIIIKKENLDTDESISVIIDYKRNVNVKVVNREVVVDRESGVFSFNLAAENNELNDVESLAFFVRPDATYYELKNSEYLISLEDFKYSTINSSNFVSKQDSYFNFLEFGIETNKRYHNVNVTLNDNLKNIDTIYIRDRKNYPNYYFSKYSNLRDSNILFYRLDNISVYLYNESTERLKRLIPAIDFYIDGTDQLVIADAGSDDIYEVFIRPSSGQVFSFYTESNNESFKFIDALHDNNFGKWKPIIVSSTFLVFEDGSFVSNNDRAIQTDSFTTSLTANTEYILEDVVWDVNTDPTQYSSTMTAILVNSSHNFDNFNKYQISTDPYFNTYGEGFAVGTDFTEQEVYLYDTGLEFLLDTAEPYVTDGADITIQGITDPYPAFLTTVNDNYYDFQTDDGSGNSKVTNLLLNDIDVQTIESQISKLKKNYQGMIGNSNLPYSTYSTKVDADKFLFLVLKGISGNTFTLTYRDDSDNIIKREYNCTLGTNGLYVSLPFFLDTFATENAQNGIHFEVDDNVTHYYIFR